MFEFLSLYFTYMNFTTRYVKDIYQNIKIKILIKSDSFFSEVKLTESMLKN